MQYTLSLAYDVRRGKPHFASEVKNYDARWLISPESFYWRSKQEVYLHTAGLEERELIGRSICG